MSKKGSDLKWGGLIYKITKGEILDHPDFDKNVLQGPITGHYFAVDAEEIIDLHYEDPEARDVIIVNNSYQINVNEELSGNDIDGLYTEEAEAEALAKSLNEAEWKRHKTSAENELAICHLLENVMSLKGSKK